MCGVCMCVVCVCVCACVCVRERVCACMMCVCMSGVCVRERVNAAVHGYLSLAASCVRVAADLKQMGLGSQEWQLDPF